MLASRQNLRQFVVYVVIGAIGVGVDLGCFVALLRIHTALAIAVSLAFLASVVVHFTLNKYLNFRNFDRPLLHQARTYLLVATFVWLFTLGWVEFFVRFFGIGALLAKISVMPLNVIIGYVATRYLTFGPGIGASMRAWFAAYSQRNNL